MRSRLLMTGAGLFALSFLAATQFSAWPEMSGWFLFVSAFAGLGSLTAICMATFPDL